MESSNAPSPTTLLLQYQKDWINDKSRFKLWLKARQVGYSFAGTLGPVLDAVTQKRLWVFLSKGQRQSMELGRKAKDHLDAIRAIEVAARGATLVDEEYGVVDGVRITQTTVEIPHTQSRLIFLPANPDTARGYTGNVMFDEFAFHRDSKQIYAAVYPSISRGYRIEMGSTPNGEGNMFYELATKKSAYSAHKTDIFDAVRDGLARSIGRSDEEYIADLREGCPDEDIWQQEYCCQFLSDATSYIPWEMITQAESAQASLDLLDGFKATGELYLGVDIGRHRDLTVIVVLEKVFDVYYVRAVIRMRGRKFAEQRAVIDGLYRTLPIRRHCQDSTGLGAQMAEELVTEYGASRVEPVLFNLAVKEDLAVRTRRVFENGAIRIPEDRALRAAIHAVRRIPTAAGHFRFDADRTDAGHADEFWALALALMAADGRKLTLGITLPSSQASHSQTRGYL